MKKTNKTAINLLLAANAISSIAQGISMLAIPWYFAKANEADTFSLIFMSVNAVAILWIPYAGAIVDRFNRKSVFLGLTFFCGILTTALALVGFFSDFGTPAWAVGLAFAANFLNWSIHYPCLYAFGQEVSQPEDYGKVTSTIEIVGQVTTVTAGALSAILLEGTKADGSVNFFGYTLQLPFQVQSWAIEEIFLVDGLTYFVAFAIILLIRYEPLRVLVAETGSINERLKTGLNFLREKPNLMLFGVLSYCVFVGLLVTMFTTLAPYVQFILLRGGDIFALGDVFYAVGAIGAGLLVHRFFSRYSLPFGVTVLTFVAALAFVALWFNRDVVTMFCILFFLGVANAGVRILRMSYLFAHIPNHLSGRANGIFNLINVATRIVFSAAFALPFFQRTGIVDSMMVFAVFLFAVGGLLIWNYRKF